MNHSKYVIILMAITVSTSSFAGECIDTSGRSWKELCTQVSIDDQAKTIGQALDRAEQLNHQKPGIRCSSGFFQARVAYSVEVLRDGLGIPYTGSPIAVQLRERLECLSW